MAPPAVTGPDLEALVVDGAEGLTTRSWEARSDAVARGLADRGVRPGHRVGLRFDARNWPDFAAAWLGVVKSGAAAVLVSAGASAVDAGRALARSGAAGVVCAPHLAPAAPPAWVAACTELEDAGRRGPAPVAGGNPATADVVWPPAPLAPPLTRPRGAAEDTPVPGDGGVLVHTWEPCSVGGLHALELARQGRLTPVATVGPQRLCALVAERGAGACGLTPAGAAVLVGSGLPAGHDLRSVTRLQLSGPVGDALAAGLRAAFPRACLALLAGGQPAGGEQPEVVAPVAASQEGMIWHEQLVPGSFNLPCLVRRYQGPLDAVAMDAALAELARRHQPLRTTFSVVGGRARQLVHAGRPPMAPLVDLGALDEGRRDAEVAGLLADASSRPFDLAAGPLFEPRLVRLGPDDHLLVIRLHHTTFDDWSVDVFRRELSALYRAAVEGSPPAVPEPSTTFAAFSQRQADRLAGDAGVASRAWWRRELAGAPLSVQLALGADGGAVEGAGDGQPVRLDLPPALAAGLRALAPQLRATPFMVVLAAFSLLVARRTGQDDLLLATVVAARNRTEVEPLLGCFTKKVPLRLRLAGEPSFPELVARARASLLGALSHQDLAFDAAVNEGIGRPAADHGVVPQVSVVFQGETPRRAPVALPGLAGGPFEVPAESRRERHFSARSVDGDSDGGPGGPVVPEWGDGAYLGTFLILSLLEEPGGMALIARGVFSRPAGRRLLEQLQALLADLVEAPEGVSTVVPAPPPAGGGGGAGDPAAGGGEVLDVRGFRVRRRRLETALARCPGVADVAVGLAGDAGGAARLVAWVVPGPGQAPTLAGLRRALWATLPGSPWPAALVLVDRLARRADGSVEMDELADPPPPAATDREAADGEAADREAAADPVAAALVAMWREVAGRPVGPATSYWQDFSFLEVVAEARAAGMAVPDEVVARARTPEVLAAALGGGPAR
ncbi:MAG: condensation domain-containing protein [Acidimicrobiales bacterium]